MDSTSIETIALWIPGYVFGLIWAKAYKDFSFKGNRSKSLFLDIEILDIKLSIIKLFNSNETYYLIKLLKNMDLLISSITSLI